MINEEAKICILTVNMVPYVIPSSWIMRESFVSNNEYSNPDFSNNDINNNLSEFSNHITNNISGNANNGFLDNMDIAKLNTKLTIDFKVPQTERDNPYWIALQTGISALKVIAACTGFKNYPNWMKYCGYLGEFNVIPLAFCESFSHDYDNATKEHLFNVVLNCPNYGYLRGNSANQNAIPEQG